MKPVEEFQKELRKSRASSMIEFDAKKLAYKNKRKEAEDTHKDDPLGLEEALKELGTPPDDLLSPTFISTDPTIEGLTANLGITRGSLGVFSDEGGSFLGGHSMSKENRLKTSATLSSLWDGKPINRTRSTGGVVETYYGRRLAVHLMTQPIAAEQLLADPIANGQGPLARCLIAAPKSTIGTRMSQDSDPSNVARVAKVISERIAKELPVEEGTQNTLRLRKLLLSADAKRLLCAFADEVESGQRTDGPYAAITAFASKAAEHAARIAGVLTLFEDLGAMDVSEQSMADAIILARFYLSEAKRLHDGAIIPKDVQDAEKLRVWLVDAWDEDFINTRPITNRGPLRDTKTARAALKLLEEAGCLEKAPQGVSVGGHSAREAWRLIQ